MRKEIDLIGGFSTPHFGRFHGGLLMVALESRSKKGGQNINQILRLQGNNE